MQTKLDEQRQSALNTQASSLPVGTTLTAGPNLGKQESPAPIAYVDSFFRLNSAKFSDTIFDDHVYGSDARTAANRYKHGLVPTSACACSDEVLVGTGNCLRF